MNIRYLIAFLLTMTSLQLQAAPEAKLWDFWQAHNPASNVQVDHSPWNDWLDRYVVTDDSGLNRIRYDQVKTEDKKLLKQYITSLSNLPVRRYNRDEQQAYWINLYNALTIDVVLDHYPVKSIRDINISPGLFSRGPWKKKLIAVEQQAVSLDDIEHRILRPIWQDARIHYAVNCASLGCPNLSDQAFTADNTDQLLTQGAIDFINHPRGVSISDGDLEVSSIYDWFKEDFGSSDRNIIRHLLEYAKPELKQQLQSIKRIDDDDYDWNLNGVN
ncbi:MAG: DUF547 domain-containing protein [Amphritea sp.]|nr:DUF547 domain-containing protein [Amphritea sp.]